MRQDWHNYFLDIAEKVSTRSTCDRLHVGAVLVKEKNIIATGYNGSPSGMPHCDEVGHLMKNNSCQRTIHAEQNAIIQAAKNGAQTKGAILYISHSPCYTCAKFIVTAGIEKVYVRSLYSSSEGVDLLTEAGVQFNVV